MTDLESRVLKDIHESSLLKNSTSIIVGVSGGPDSVALLYLLTTLIPDRTYTGVYVNHNLRPQEIAREHQVVQALCQKLAVNFETVSVDVLACAQKSNRSVEDCARHMRYQALETIRRARNAQLIAVGHTSDDQVEQFFIRLIRGSGLRGLGGMIPRRDRIVRPLLGLKKIELLQYLEERNLDFWLDSSNTSKKFLRNRIRLGLLPVLEREYNASIHRTIRNTMSLIQDEDNYIDGVIQQLYSELVHTRSFHEAGYEREEIYISTQQLLNNHPALRRRVIEKMFWEAGCAPTFKNIEIVSRLMEHGRTGATSSFPDNCICIKTFDSLLFTRLAGNTRSGKEKFRFAESIKINGPGLHQISAIGLELELKESSAASFRPANGFYFDADRIDYPLLIRAPFEGESFKPLGAPGRKKVSRILSDKKIPRHLRYRFPVITSGNSVLGILGLMISDDCKVNSNTRRCAQITLQPMTH